MITVQVKVLREEELRSIIGVVVGTRPGIIKLSPVIRQLECRNVGFFVIHTGQHYSYNMDQAFFEDLQLREPKYKLDTVKSCTLHGEQTAEMLKGCEKALIEEKPRVVVVGGDANTNLAGALAARKLAIGVAHVEAGLRSDDWRMPEEHNRVMIDHIAEYLFAPTEKAKYNLLEDNVKGTIIVTGNTIVDAVFQNKDLAEAKSTIMDALRLSPQDYFLVTVHREETVDVGETFQELIETLALISRKYNLRILFPVHPRTRKRIDEFKLGKQVASIGNLELIDPLRYLDFLLLLSNTKLVLTDSGGIQEEACVLGVPCVTLRQNTERPETVEVGANLIAGTKPDKVTEAMSEMLSRRKGWKNPFGDGNTGRTIVECLANNLEKGK